MIGLRVFIFKKEKTKDGRYSIILFQMRGPDVCIEKPGTLEEKLSLEEKAFIQEYITDLV